MLEHRTCAGARRPPIARLKSDGEGNSWRTCSAVSCMHVSKPQRDRSSCSQRRRADDARTPVQAGKPGELFGGLVVSWSEVSEWYWLSELIDVSAHPVSIACSGRRGLLSVLPPHHNIEVSFRFCRLGYVEILAFFIQSAKQPAACSTASFAWPS